MRPYAILAMFSLALSTLVGLCAPLPAESAVGDDLTCAAEAAYNCGDYELAEPLYLQAMAALSASPGEPYARAMGRLANCYYMEGKLGDAVRLYQQVVALDEKCHGLESLQVADDLFNLTRSLRRQSLFDDAEPVILRTLDIRRKVLGEDHRLVAMSWMDLAVNYQRQKKYPESESAFLKTIGIRERAFSDQPKFLAPAYFRYGKMLEEIDRSQQGQKFEHQAHELCPEVFQL